jgi:hypothetical protein
MSSQAGVKDAPQANRDAGPVVSACMTVRADVSVEEVLTYFRTQGTLPNGLVLFVLDHNHDFVGTVSLSRLASAQASMLVRDLMHGRPRLEGHSFEAAPLPSGNGSSSKKGRPSVGSIWLAFTLTILTLGLLVLVLVTLAKT